MRRKRVLIVADSVVIRRSLAEALAPTPGILVVGSAASGRIALMKIPLLRPDVVALDMEMPETTGLETLSAIRTGYPTLPVIMLSPARDLLGAELAAKIRQYSPEQPCFSAAGPEQEHVVPLPNAGGRAALRVDVLAIAVSTGGPSALMDLIPRFAKDFPVPIVIVQHMPPTFTALLAERLAARSSIRVVEGALHQTLAPGCASIAPGDFHMAVVRDGDAVRVRVQQEAPENSCRPSADVLFRSVAEVYGRHVLAVVMTGMGRDGLNGCEHIRDAGGQIIVQDEQSSVVWGMPGFVVKAGMADQILPLSALGPEIIRKVWNHRRSAVKPAVTPGLCAPRASEAGGR